MRNISIVTLLQFLSTFTSAQVNLVKDINPGAGAGYVNQAMTPGGSLVFFNANAAPNGIQPWRSNGTDAGTFMLKDVFPSPSSLIIGASGYLDGNFYFFANNTLWKSNGTTAGTTVLRNFLDASFFGPIRMFRFGNRLFMNWGVTGTGDELWRTDGTSAGTVLVKDINTGSGHSIPRDFIIHGGKMYFTAFTSSFGRELYVTDGTEAGTQLVKDIRPGSANSEINGMVSTPLGLFFSANDGTNGFELWRSDGTSSGTNMVVNLHPSGDGFKNTIDVAAATAYANGKVFFRGNNGVSGDELFATDGTPGGTYLVKELSPGAQQGIFNSPVVAIPFTNKVVVIATGGEPWVSDGNESTTVQLKDINPGGNGSLARDFIPHQGRLYFLATTATNGQELWVTNGTEAGTQLVADVRPGPIGSNIDHLTSADNHLFFWADNGTIGHELYAFGPTVGVPVLLSRQIEINVYPNPANDLIRVETEEGAPGLLQLFNAAGTPVRQINLEKDWTTTQIQIRDLPKGIYSLHISTAKGSASRQVAVE
jgi:ELWxxDGT repeat protein